MICRFVISAGLFAGTMCLHASASQDVAPTDLTHSADGGAAADLRVEGRTLDEWRQTMKSLELDSPAAVDAVPGLIELLRDVRVPEQTRTQAAYTLGRIGAAAESAIPVLATLLVESGDGNSSTPRWAAKALALFGVRAAPSTPDLIAVAAGDERPLPAQLAATEALGRIGGAHPDAIPALMRLAGHNHASTTEYASGQRQAAAIDSLAMIGPPAGAAVPLLIRLTRSTSGDIRRRAATALGAVGTAAGVATESLVDLVLFDDMPAVRDAGAGALATIGEPGQAALAQLLDDEDIAVRRRSASALVDVTPMQDATRERLIPALKDPDPDVRISAVAALQGVDYDPEHLLRVLLGELSDPDRPTRIRAYRLLVAMPTATSALPELKRLAEDERPYVRQAARKAIEVLTADAADDSPP